MKENETKPTNNEVGDVTAAETHHMPFSPPRYRVRTFPSDEQIAQMCPEEAKAGLLEIAVVAELQAFGESSERA